MKHSESADKNTDSALTKLHWWRHITKKQVAIASSVVLFAVVVAQMLYPSDRLLPFARVDGIDVAGWHKKDVIWQLDTLYAKQQTAIYFGKNAEPTSTEQTVSIGVTVHNTERVQTHTYPWYIRLVPTSVLWYELVNPLTAAPQVQRDVTVAQQYVKDTIGENCDVPAQDADLKVESEALVLVPSQDGGTCDVDRLVELLLAIQPTKPQQQKVHVPVTPVPPKISDADAEKVADTVNQQLQDGVTVKYAGGSETFDAKTVAKWLKVQQKKKTIAVSVSPKKANDMLQTTIGSKVNKSAGTTKVTTYDFTETKRTNGAKGLQLDTSETAANITQFLRGNSDSAKVAIRTVQPKVDYTRAYSKSNTGLSAKMQHFAEAHSGVYGVQMIELEGQGRRAGYNSSRQFTAASTYKLFVAYSTLKKIEAGKFKWSDKIHGGRDLAACFDDMIVVSDNDCALALIKKVTRPTIDSDMRSLGLTSTTSQAWGSPSPWRSTASDLATFLAALDTGSMSLNNSSRDRLIGAMKRNIYRQGIPSGTSATVANKVGFLWNLLHDASIVYSPKGTYVLVILTDGSSWGNIAQLTRELEKLR